MLVKLSLAALATFLVLTIAAWRRYLWVARQPGDQQVDACNYSLTEAFDDRHLVNTPHQEGVEWLTDVFSRSARKYPDHTALQIPHTGESLSFAELDRQAEKIATALSDYLTGPDQVVAVAMSQDNWQIVASHLAILKAGGVMMFLDSSLPDVLIEHMLGDAVPVVILTRGLTDFRGLPTLDVLSLPDDQTRREPPDWLDDPSQRLATLFYTSGTTGMPKGVESPHAGYVNLALSYADYFQLAPGIDATSLTSSLGYDGSISEMYSAWVSGCSVVLLTGEQVRSGPDLVPILCAAEVTVLFCPPVLLTTLTANPHMDLPYPICRYIVPAGEAFPSALVEPWTRARRQIINTYGPTEASTDTSRQSLKPGEPVTIGTPLANVTYVVLEIGEDRPLPHGETGELCIGGVHVAKGYRNLPELTSQKFITHPRFGRLYRTGDRCKIDVNTRRVHFLGRIDSQLKVRGHRVETQAIEDALQGQFTEIEAAILDYQNEELIAFVSAPSIGGGSDSPVAPAPAEWADDVLSVLERQLPAASVPSRIFLVDKFVMKPVSGKIDREHLPNLARFNGFGPEDARLVESTEYAEASHGEEVTAVETGNVPGETAEVLEICREIFEMPLGWDDVFAEHGGHSIIIARLAQRLNEAGWMVPVRALLGNCNTARKVAWLERAGPESSVSPATDDESCMTETGHDEPASKVLSTGSFTVLQLLFLCILYAPPLAGFLGLVAYAEIGEFFMTAHIADFVIVGFLMYLVALVLPFAGLLWVMLIKLLMGGHLYINRIAPGIYPKWSRMHLRIWCVGRLQSYVLVPLGTMFRSAPLMAYVLRRLGASIGDNLQCAHNVEFAGPLDLFSAGDDVAIQTGAYIHTSRWHGQELHVGPVHLESHCKIGMRAGIANHVTVGRGSWICPFTPVLDDVGEFQVWDGSPARLKGRRVELERTSENGSTGRHPGLMESFNILMQVFLDFCLVVAPMAAVTWFASNLIPVNESISPGEYFTVTPLPTILWNMSLYGFVTGWLVVVLVSILICLFLRVTPSAPGIYPTRGLRAYLLLYRMKKMNLVQRWWTWTITGQYLRALAGLRFHRVGASECDLMLNLVPELASADSQVFWSNGCFTNMLDHGSEYIQLNRLDMPHNFFSGNNSVAEFGQLPSNFLLGASTPASDIQFRRQMNTRLAEPITIAGNPPVKFASAQFEEEHKTQTLPGLPLFLARVFLNDIFSIGFLPMAGMLLYVIFYTGLLRLDGQIITGALLALILAECSLVLLCTTIKKVLVGSKWGISHTTPFWSWRHFSYFFAQDCFFTWCKRPLRMTTGTLLSNVILRGMGCRIGKRTIIGSPMQASDWNAVSFGDDCMINGFLQFHTFEGMILRVKRSCVGNGGTVNFGATVMGGASIEERTTVLPLSLVLKEMHLAGSRTYSGSPVEQTIDNA